MFGPEWNKIRLALLTGRKYTAVVNNFSLSEETSDNLKRLTAVEMFESTFKILKKNDSTIADLKIPRSLKVFCFDNSDTSDFPAPVPDITRKSS